MQRTIQFTLNSFILSLWAHQALGQFCDLYWLHHDQLCYRYFEEGTIYSEAEANCISHGANLTDTLPEELEDLLLESSKQNETYDIWCKTEHNHDLDATTEADLSSTAPSLLFHINKRRRRSTTRCCIINSNKTFEEKPCDEERRYICVLNSTSIPQNCSEKTTSKNSRRANWEEARRQCQCEGSDLYSFKDDADIDQFSKYTVANNESIWIGLRRENGSHVFRWSDGSIVTGSVSNTVKPQIKDDEFCVAYVANASTWEATDCNLVLLFLCKTQAQPTPVTTESTESSTSPTNTTTLTVSAGNTAPPTTATTKSTGSTTPSTTTTSESAESSASPRTTTTESTKSTATPRNTTLESTNSAITPRATSTKATESTTPPTTLSTESISSSPVNTSDVTDSPIISPGIVAVKAGDERDRDSSTFGIVIASVLSVCALGALVIYAIKRKGRRGSLNIPAP